LSDRVVPLVETLPLSEFGDFLEERQSAVGLERDGTYVPGFSEMRVERDMKVGQYLRREITRDEIPNLPVNLRWARVQNKAGQPDSSKAFNHSRKGYRYVSKEDVGTDWFKELPGGATWNAAGQLQNGDCALMVASAKDAARNEANRRRELEARTSGVTNTFTQNLAQAGIRDTKGTSPTMERIGIDAKIFGEK
jgi:hypothetical protein